MKIYGKNPVLERIKADPKSIRRIFVQAGHPDHGYIASKARKHGIPIVVTSPRQMIKLGRSQNTQGLLLDVADYAYVPYDDLLDSALSAGLTLLFLDNLTDPQNLGAIIRTLGCLGGFGLVAPTHDSAGITDTVLRIACGGENHVQVARVNNLNKAIERARDKGFWIAGSVLDDAQDIREVTLNFPLGLVVGSEGKGIRDVTQKRLDVRLTIPMARPRMSLNVAHATAIFAYEITRQKKKTR